VPDPVGSLLKTVWNGGERQATIASPVGESSVISRFAAYAAGPLGNAGRDHGRMDSSLLSVDTTGSTVIDLTAELLRYCRDHGDGLVNVFVPHATAGVALMEVGSGSEADLEAALARLLPRDDRYRHRHGATGHGADHLLPVLVSPSLNIPVLGGRPLLGTWQSLVLVDTNGDNPRRQVRLSFMAG
jgi:secondary thiamine-phosphate synthase enzyme